MRNKVKTAMITILSFMLLSLIQVSTASTTEATAFELTGSNMDAITAGGRARARARGSRSAITRTGASVTPHLNTATAVAIATGSNSSAHTSASASGDIVKHRNSNRRGRDYATSWSVAYGYNR